MSLLPSAEFAVNNSINYVEDRYPVAGQWMSALAGAAILGFSVYFVNMVRKEIKEDRERAAEEVLAREPEPQLLESQPQHQPPEVDSDTTRRRIMRLIITDKKVA